MTSGSLKISLHHKYYGYEMVVYGNGPEGVEFTSVSFISFR